ncbi:CheR family methyltransferase [Aquaspirillum serpens]|uniref:CheR family methyltransferase n=1 Tax=Aquaspirillum serpens TaxID=190 RepID=UPI000401076C|nr:CheR family methyltransferase [Aquaspirillum serpens]
MQQKYFEKQADGRYRVKPVLRNMITFRQINLVENNWPIRNKFDAIFCRNVMIYFDRDTQYAVLKKFHPLLKQNGLLFVGHSENLYHATDLFKLRGKTVYELAAR